MGLCARDYINRPLDDTLSGGELKRIELAMALAKGGDVLLFDEPEAGIDLWSFEGLVNLFKNLKDKTIIIVSHQKKIIDNAHKIAAKILQDKKDVIEKVVQILLDKETIYKLKSLSAQVTI